MAELMCLAECALGLLAVTKKDRKNAKCTYVQIFGSMTTKYVITACRTQGWIEVAGESKAYYQGRFTVYPYVLTDEGRALLAGTPYPLSLLAKRELTVKEAASVLGVTRSRVAQMLSNGTLQATTGGHKRYIQSCDLYSVWWVKRWKNINIKSAMLPLKH